MSLNRWNRVKPLEDISSIDRLEKKYGFELSSELKSCLLKNNGGRPEPNTIKLENGQEYDVKMLLSYNEKDTESIYRVIMFFTEKYHGSVIPFATDSEGNYYCEQDCKIVLWTQDGASLYPVCDNFTVFLDLLYEL